MPISSLLSSRNNILVEERYLYSFVVTLKGAFLTIFLPPSDCHLRNVPRALKPDTRSSFPSKHTWWGPSCKGFTFSYVLYTPLKVLVPSVMAMLPKAHTLKHKPMNLCILQERRCQPTLGFSPMLFHRFTSTAISLRFRRDT